MSNLSGNRNKSSGRKSSDKKRSATRKGSNDVFSTVIQQISESIAKTNGCAILFTESVMSGKQHQILSLVNAERSNAGLELLSHNPELCNMAKYQCLFMGSSLNTLRKSTHLGKKGETLQNRMHIFGFYWEILLENVGRNQENAEHFVRSIMKDANTRGRVMDERVTEHGVFVVRDWEGRCLYWCQILRRPSVGSSVNGQTAGKDTSMSGNTGGRTTSMRGETGGARTSMHGKKGGARTIMHGKTGGARTSMHGKTGGA